jgi:hypothetical protein
MRNSAVSARQVFVVVVCAIFLVIVSRETSPRSPAQPNSVQYFRHIDAGRGARVGHDAF